MIRPGWPHLVFTNRPDGSYATGDLFERHTSIPRAWRYIGRTDDILVLSNGEKVDPVAIEGRLRASPHIHEAVVFGADRSVTGVLVQLKSVDGRSAAELVELVWPDVVEANRLAPTFAQILRDMIVPLTGGDAERGFPTASKGSIQRPMVYKRYAELIERTYEAFERAGGGGDQAKITFRDAAEAETVVREAIVATLGGEHSLRAPLELDMELFAFGLNSLHTARVRNVLQTVRRRAR